MTLGHAALTAGDYVGAISWLEQLPREGEAGAALDEATYAYAAQLEADGQTDAAMMEYASLGDYKDSLERVKAIEYAAALSEMETAPESSLLRFEGLGSYKDAKKLVQQCRYLAAKKLYDKGEYEQALAEFELLGDYEDAKSQVRRSRYAMAGVKMEEGEFDEAAELFESCGAYLDAEERAMKAQYAKAAAHEAAGEYQQAAKAFAELGSYEDAKLRVAACEDAWLKAAYSGARMDMELGDYASVIEGLKPYWQAELPARYEAIADMYEDACLQRAQMLIDMRRPLDALELLEEIQAINKSAKKKLDAYVYRIIGRWKDARGREYTFRRDGSCTIAGEAGYFGGSGYDIAVGAEKYPTKAAYSVVSLRNKTLTLKNLSAGTTVRLSYLGEPAPAEESEIITEE